MKYYIYESANFQRGKQYLARAKPKDNNTMEQLIQEMLALGSGTDEADIRAVMHLAKRAKLNFIERGETWDDGVTSVSYAVGGTFTGPADSFQNPRNILRLHAHSSKELLEKTARITMEKMDPPSNAPDIYNVLDNTTQKVDGSITSAGPFELGGSNFTKKLVIHWRNAAGVSVDSPVIMETTAHKIRAMAPTLVAGNYELILDFADGQQASRNITII